MTAVGESFFDRVDVCEAYYIFARAYQSRKAARCSATLARLDKLRFRPSKVLSVDFLTRNGRRILIGLIRSIGTADARWTADDLARSIPPYARWRSLSEAELT